MTTIIIAMCGTSGGLPSAAAQSFDHGLYRQVLARFLKGGRVDYAALKDDPAVLDAYLADIGGLDPEILAAMPDEERMAFYINAYNAVTLKVIADNYPVGSIRKIRRVWDIPWVKTAQRELTLNDIEHRILRKEFNEPRVHFALVCASIGCPQLAGEPFTAEGLEGQLEKGAVRFINDRTRVRLDRDKGILYVSPIFKWFGSDFGDIREFIARYIRDDAEYIRRERPKIGYLDYDWSLNGIKK